MRFLVDVGTRVMEQIALDYPPRRTAAGDPDQFDFLGGPLATAIDQFKGFDLLPAAVGPSVRVATVVDPMFGAVTFTGVLIGEGRVEIAEYIADPDFWSGENDDAIDDDGDGWA